jgi:pyruvate kinase
VFAVTTDPLTCRQLAAVWGVHPELARVPEVTYESLTAFGRERVLASGAGEHGAAIVVTAGYPFHQAGATNTMRIELL